LTVKSVSSWCRGDDEALNPTCTEPSAGTRLFHDAEIADTAVPVCVQVAGHSSVTLWLPGQVNRSVHEPHSAPLVLVMVILAVSRVLHPVAR
jgi:hypothetical protein